MQATTALQTTATLQSVLLRLLRHPAQSVFFWFQCLNSFRGSLYKLLLVVLIHAREAVTVVMASCANNDQEVSVMSRVGSLMV